MKSLLFSFLLACLSLLFLFSTPTDAFQLWRRNNNNNEKKEGQSKPSSGALEQLFADDFLNPFFGWPGHRGHHHHPALARYYNNPFFTNELWDPFHRMDDIWSELDRSLWKSPIEGTNGDLMKAYSPLMNTDLIEGEKDYHLSIDLPGIQPKDLEIHVEEVNNNPQNKVLTLKAERKQVLEEHEPTTGEKEPPCEQREGENVETCPKSAPNDYTAPNKKWIRQERLFGKIERSFKLPMNADIHNAKSKYVNGVLTVSLPKIEVVAPPKKQLTIETH